MIHKEVLNSSLHEHISRISHVNMKVLLQLGADAESTCPLGITALAVSTSLLHVQGVKLLLSYGADPHRVFQITDGEMTTPFNAESALAAGLEVYKRMITKGLMPIDPNVPDKAKSILTMLHGNISMSDGSIIQ